MCVSIGINKYIFFIIANILLLLRFLYLCQFIRDTHTYIYMYIYVLDALHDS